MRILFTRFPLESAFGGAEVQTLALMSELVKRGHTVEFLGSCPVLSAEAPKIGVRVTHLDIGPPPVSLGAAASFFWRRFAMERALIQAMESMSKLPEAVCMLSLSEKLLLTVWLTGRGVKVVWIEHDRVGRWLAWNPWLPSLRRAAASARVVCVSQLSRGIYVGLGFHDNRVTAIPNGIDMQRLRTAAAPQPEPPAGGPLRVGCLARLSEEKGIDVLIHALRDVPNATLDIVGTGPQEGFVRKLIGEMEIAEHQTGRIRLISRVDDLAAFYRSLQVFVLPSIENDPFGLVAGEAMALGVPTIVTDHCGIAGYLQAREALVVPAGSVGALSKAILSLNDAGMWSTLSQAGPKLVAQRFSITMMADGYEKLLMS